MSCASQPLTLSQAQLGDLYMDQAIYHSGTDKIYGVRGQWLFKFNATTAVLEASLRFSINGCTRTTITSIGSNLYIGLGGTTDPIPGAPFPNPSFPGRDIYIVDTGTFTTSGRFHFDTKLGFSYGDIRDGQFYMSGWSKFVTDGTKLYGWGDNNTVAGAFKVDPSNLPGFARQSWDGQMDFEYDAANSAIWSASPDAPNIWVHDTDFTSFNQAFNAGPSCGAVSGICKSIVANKVYVVRNTFELLMVDVSTVFPGYNNFAFTVFNTGRINANPFKVKAVNGLAGNPYNNKVLIPAFADDTVLIWDPSTDNVANMVIKSGFTSPFDCVITPTKAFALQSGTVGLKEIT